MKCSLFIAFTGAGLYFQVIALVIKGIHFEMKEAHKKPVSWILPFIIYTIANVHSRNWHEFRDLKWITYLNMSMSAFVLHQFFGSSGVNFLDWRGEERCNVKILCEFIIARLIIKMLRGSTRILGIQGPSVSEGRVCCTRRLIPVPVTSWHFAFESCSKHWFSLAFEKGVRGSWMVVGYFDLLLV